jgi:predicted RNase H-like HicB family nuclease
MAAYTINLQIEHLPEGPYLGTSPDLPGLIVQAVTPEEVVRLAPLIAHDLIEVMRETGQPLPPQLLLQPIPPQVSVLVPV